MPNNNENVFQNPLLKEINQKTPTTKEELEIELLPTQIIDLNLDPLSEVEKQKRHQLEKTVEKAFYLAGEALKELRDLRLYRDTHRSFEDYCRERFGHTRQKSNYLIAGAQVYKNLTTNRCHLLPSNEYQIRPLARLNPAQQIQVWEEAVLKAEGKSPSASLVKQTIIYLIPSCEINPHYLGEICLVISSSEPQLRGLKGCWAIVTNVDEFTCDLQLWNGLVKSINPVYLKSLKYSEVECLQMKNLSDRLQRLTEKDSLEEVAYIFLEFLGKLKRPQLTPLEEKILALLEQKYGIT